MTLLSVCKAVSLKIGIDQPTAVVGSTDRELLELLGIANDSAKMIADGYEWQDLMTVGVLTGDGVATSFSKPSDYDRMLKNADLWPNSNLQAPLIRIYDADEWLGIDTQLVEFITGNWIMYGGLFHVKPVMSVTETASFFYISNEIISDQGSTSNFKTSFDNDLDAIRVGTEELLKLAMIFKWKQAKGQAYAEAMTDYEDRKEREMGSDHGPRKIYVGMPRRPRGVEYPYPYAIVP